MTTPHLSIALDDASAVGEARRLAVRAAQSLGFDETATGRVAIAATELGTNLVRHARQGRLLIGTDGATGAGDAGGPASIELISLDRGPGMANIAACLADGYSSRSTPGNGLGAVRRAASQFDVISEADRGTVIVARLSASHGTSAASPAPRSFELGGIVIAAPGETLSGDGWAYAVDDQHLSIFVADGLGHGPQAKDAASAGAEAFATNPFGRPGEVLQRVHERLRSTRGAAVAMVRIDRRDRRVTFAGAGNIAGRLLSGVEDRTLLSQPGTAGLQIRRLQDVTYPWPTHGLLVLQSDGLTSRWNLSADPHVLQHSPSAIAAWLVRDHARGRDDTTVVVLRLEESP